MATTNSTYVVKPGQSAMDVALMMYGNAQQGLVWLLEDNRLPELIVYVPGLERYEALDRPGWVRAGETLEQIRAKYAGFGAAWVPPAGFRLNVRTDQVVDAAMRDYLADFTQNAPLMTAI